ncbi:uncharacterized protein [Triticum aestivum]|uniref:uncharacterized protein isoform X2 n=1 Tax=Triticum aestivum TaxID=4565 RepID=UPI001D006A0C|nr:uncharacterized protein LOC123061340 isoform X2 [Triticum aestivum]
MPTSYYGGRVTHRKEEFPQHPARGRLLVSAERVILHGSWWRSGSLTVCPAISALRTIVDYVACSRNRWTQQTPHGVQGWFQQLAVLKGSLVPRRNRTLAVSCVHRTEEVSKVIKIVWRYPCLQLDYNTFFIMTVERRSNLCAKSSSMLFT